MAGEETACCMTLVVLIGIAVVIWILVKGAKFLGYIGQWRTGSALKHMSREGITIHQGQEYQPRAQRHVRRQPEPFEKLPTNMPQPVIYKRSMGTKIFCSSCGEKIDNQAYCPFCGAKHD